MKKIRVTNFLAAVITILCLLAFASVSFATDVQIEKKIDQIVFKKDKNGSEYARIIVQGTGDLNGVQYTKAMSVMAFGDQAKEAKMLKKGMILKAICAEQQFRGATNYQLLKVLK